MEIIKHMKQSEITSLAAQVEIASNQVVSKTIVQNEAISMTIFAFDKGEEIATHESNGDALVQVLEGSAKLTIDGKPYVVNAGECIIMPHNVPHAVYAVEPFKMLLTQVF